MTDNHITSFQQRQYYWLQNLDLESSAYTVPLLFTIEGRPDISALRQSYCDLVNTYDVLRMSYHPDKAGLTCIIGNNVSIELPLCKLSDTGNDSLMNEIVAFFDRPFDMKNGPLIRSILFQTESDSFIWCIAIQHSIADLRTKELICQYIGNRYRELNSGNPDSVIKGVSIDDYMNYAQKQNQWILSDAAFKMKEFWKKTLDGYPQNITLPLDYKRPAVLKLQGTVEQISFDLNMSNKIREFSKVNQVTPFLCLLTSYSVLLARLSCQEKIVLGIPFTNRREIENKDIIGCFVNILPIPVDLKEDVTMAECMKAIRQTMLLAHRNQELPAEIIINEVKNEPNTLDHNPVYQVGFTFEPMCSLSLDSCSVLQRYIHHGGSQLDMFATFWEEDNEIKGVFEYNNTLFTKSTVERWAHSFEYLVNNFIESPELPIHKISVTTTEENEMIDSFSVNNMQCISENESFIELFTRSVQKNSSKTAIRFNDRIVTYSELDMISNAVASHLSIDGIGPDQFVGVYMERSPEMLGAMIGIMKAGAAYLPIDPEFPQERIKFIAEDSRLMRVVTSEKFRNSEAFSSDKMIVINNIMLTSTVAVPAVVKISANSAAYMIYTSGSTGNPKGVIITNDNLSNFLMSMINEPGIKNSDIVMAITTISFDIHVLELLVPLVAGASIVLAPRECAIDGSALVKLLNDNSVTVMQATPTTWKMLCSEKWSGSPELLILSGGESLSNELAKQLIAKCKSLYNMYGPTETTVWSTIHKVTDASDQIPIGKPIANTTVVIKDAWGNRASIGCWGELLIGGSGVTRGYHNRDELTKDKFRVETALNNKPDRYYATGDICRMRADGLLECAGRIDNQVKYRGYRIELEEIENVIEKCPGIKNAAVIIHGEKNAALLVAFIVIDNSCKNIETEEIKKYMYQKLPDYMIPSRIISIEAMPLTPNRKVDRKALRTVAVSSEEKRAGSLKLTCDSVTEKKLAEIWTEKLKLDITETNVNFFDAGGNSMLLLLYRECIFTEMKVDIPTTFLLQYATIRSLADYLDSRQKTDTLQEKRERVLNQKRAMKSVARRMP